MSKFLYSAWFLDTEADGGDQDREWVACIGIEGASEEVAQGWGDTLARRRAERDQRDTFLHSSIELEDDANGTTDWSGLPRINAGQAANDEEIGW